jgi:N-glycosylase/DNA lyase
LSRKKYLEIENILRDIGKEVNLKLSELDLYIWYLRTGKVLK